MKHYRKQIDRFFLYVKILFVTNDFQYWWQYVNRFYNFLQKPIYSFYQKFNSILAINSFHSFILFDCTTICVIWQSPTIWVISISNITIFTVIWITMVGMNMARLYGLLPSKDWSLYNTTLYRPLLALALLGMFTILVALRLLRLIKLPFAKKLVIWRCFHFRFIHRCN